MNLQRITRTVDVIHAAAIGGVALALLFATLPSDAEDNQRGVAQVRRTGLPASGQLNANSSDMQVSNPAPPTNIKTSFPRLGQMLIGSPQPYREASAQNQMARFDVVIVNLSEGGAATRAALRAVKQKNPNVILLDYAVVNEVSLEGPGQKYLRDKLNAEKWWQYSGSSPLKSVWPGAGMTNYTTGYAKWYAEEQYRRVWSQVPELDGLYEDNFFWRARVGGMGTPAHRAGMLTYLNAVKRSWPGKIYTANIGDWRNTPSVPEYEGQLQGGTLEGYLCRFERSFAETLKEYHRRMREVAPPKLVMFNAEKCASSGFDRYKSFRYGFAITLMNDGYYNYNDNYTRFPTQWFDEYDLAGTSNTSWLGEAVDPPQASPWQDGVFRRRFEHGMALVNGSGSTQTVNIGPGYRKIKGAQVTSVTITGRDGLILVGESGGHPPPPPLVCPVGCVPAP